MYLPSSKACDVRNGQTPIPAAEIAAGQMARARIDRQVNSANKAWAQVLRRNWQSFGELGPQVAFQVLNAPIGASPPSVFRGSGPSSPVGVDISRAPAAAGGAGPGDGRRTSETAMPPDSRRTSGKTGSADQAAFVERFGRALVPYQKYTGPLPPQGTAMSLVYGGSPSNRPAAVGATPPSMPVAQRGYFSSSCPMPDGVNSIPLGEPAYPAPDGGDGADGLFGVGGTILALLALAGLAYVADRNDKKHGRVKA